MEGTENLRWPLRKSQSFNQLESDPNTLVAEVGGKKFFVPWLNTLVLRVLRPPADATVSVQFDVPQGAVVAMQLLLFRHARQFS